MKKAVKVILLSLGIIVLLAAAGVGIWLLTKKEAPIENEDQPKKGNVLGVEWYDEDGTEFTLNTIEELREFAALSEHYDFEGQTIKLGADIVDNEGNAADWEDVIPEHLWKPIQHFAGTFDGQGHTISGICSYGFVYIVRDAKTIFCKAGMFTDTKAACTIRDFRIVNSFFYGDFNEGTGSVASNGGGTFDSIYSSAIVVSYKENTGGIVGILDAKGAHTVTNCWFDGILRVEGNVGHYAGGIVGQVGPTGGTCKIEHCLNTGSLSSTLVNTGVNLGGIAGVIMDAGRVYVRDCLAVGDLTNDYSIAVGSVIGQVAGAASISDVYAVRESYKAIIGYKAGSIIGYPIEYTKKMLSGNGGYQWTTLDFDEYWSVVEGSTPVLKYFADSSPSVAGIEKKYDTDWYQKELTEFLITNEKELYGLAIVSRTTDFAGKTVKLGADIVVNEGNAADWAEEDPESCWVPIGTVDYPFKGTFDGQMHSISGICYKTNANYSGLFSTTTDVTVIQNMKLLNSYFDFGGQSSGSIAGRGRGKFDTVYSSAIVSGRNINLGGLVGQIPGDGGIVMNNCWFDGQLTNTSNSLSTRYTGGLVGVVLSDSLMSNCLNTGTVDATNFTTPNPNNAANIVPLAAGLIGYIPTGKTMTIRGCLNAGDINVNEVASIGFGSIAGYVDGSARVSDTYAVAESAGLHSMAHCLTGEVAVLERSELTGCSAYQKTLLDFDEYWAVAENDTPVLKSFAENTPSLDGVEKIYDVSWYSIEADTYVLDSPEDLYGFALMSYNTDFSGKTIKLGANVVLNKGQASTWSQNAPENEWIQIGKTSKAFAGTFDGQWHRISGVYLKTDDRFGGLFAKTTPTAVIRNLVLTNSYIEGTGGDCGSIVGRGEGGSFSSIYSSATVVCSNSRVGGLFGQLYGDRVTINNCWFAGRVVGTGNSTSARTTGGILGLFAAKTGSMTNCLNTGVVNTSAYTYNQRANGSPLVVPLAGGIIGHLWENCSLLIENSLNSGKILVSPIAEEGNVGFGAVYGWADGAVTLVNAYATTESSKRVSGGHAATVTGAIKQMDEAAIKGYDGYRWMDLDFNRYWAVVVDNEATPDTDESGTPILMSFASTVPSLADVKKMYAFDWMDKAEGTEEDPYILMDAADLLGFAQLSLGNNFEGKFVKLGADIDLNPGFTASVDGFTDGNEGVPVEWTSIGSTSKYFKGTFDGDGHTISGLYQKTTNTSNVYLGLFAATSGVSTVKNFRLENSYIYSQGARFGSIAGNGDGNFENIYSNAILVADGSHAAAAGGMVGYFDGEKDVTYSNLHFDGILTGSAYWAGGILGRASSADGITLTIQDCRNSGSLSSTDTTVGGILGLMDATDVTATVNITGSWNSGSIDVPSARGVFVGQIRNGAPTVNLTDCLNSFVPGSGAVNPVGSWRNGNLIYDCVLNVRASDVKTWSEDGTESSVSQITITSAAAEETLTPLGFDFENAWAVRSRYPVPIAFKAEEEENPDTGEDTYVLYTAEDLRNFAAISQISDFEGKTVLLGADIDLNPGFTATVSGFTDGNDGTPVQWTSIGSAACFFKGTFDGQGHKISGLYQTTASTSSVYLGLFAATGGTSMVKNLRLENSYILSKGARFGSIAGCGDGNFENIYSNAVIVAEGGYAAAAGGMIGYFDGSANVTYSNLHFDGTLT
ncbi:MAG: hypothetical protein IK088_01195, partial [Lachnospiraceae bacterium]|nr:hypothetical protein [Lachnospiraceae bacterium]